jgi:alkylation response protein AidB-like acyl-CoA dehydrogenase
VVSAAARERIRRLENIFGDPDEASNPLGQDAVLAADERGDTFAAAEAALEAFGLNAELVPERLGGRFTRLDDLVAVGRVVSRRDPALGAGYLTGSLLAGVCVWLAGDEDQCRYTADTLLAGHRLACAYHELDHGNDFASAGFTARPAGDRLVLEGHKEVVANLDRAEAVVLFAATGGGPSTARGHSQLLLHGTDLVGPHVNRLPRYATVGLRGVRLGGIAFLGAAVDAGRVLGGLGHGTEQTLKAFQLTRIAIPAMAVSALDTALRRTVRHLSRRTLYGRPAIELPHLRSHLVDVFATLLAADALASAAARSLHLHPGEGALHAATVKYTLPHLLTGAMNRLAVVLGAHSYLREGPTGIFQKLMRDLQALGSVHVGRAACRMTLLPHLPLLARRAWPGDEEPAAGLFSSDAVLPPLDLTRLRVTGAAHDHLLGGLRPAVRALIGDTGAETELPRPDAAALDARARALERAARGLTPRDLGAEASTTAAAVADEYGRLVLAAACLQTWRHRRESGDWLPAWADLVLARLTPGPAAGHRREWARERLFTELQERCADGRALDLAGLPVLGS